MNEFDVCDLWAVLDQLQLPPSLLQYPSLFIKTAAWIGLRNPQMQILIASPMHFQGRVRG